MGKEFKRKSLTMVALISAFFIGFGATTVLNKEPEKQPKTGIIRVYGGKYYDEHFQKAQEELDKLCVIWNYHLPCSIYNPEEQDAFLAYIDEQLKNNPDLDERVKSLLPIKRRLAWDERIRTMIIREAKEDDSLKQRAEKVYFQFQQQFIPVKDNPFTKTLLEIQDEIEETRRFSGDCTEFATRMVGYWRSQDHPTEKRKLRAYIVDVPHIINFLHKVEAEPHAGALLEIDKEQYVLLDHLIFDIDRDYIEMMESRSYGTIFDKSHINVKKYLKIDHDISAICDYYLDFANQSGTDIDEAINICRFVMKINPFCVNAHNSLGCFYEQKGYFEKAKMMFQKAYKIDPNDFGANVNLGCIFSSENDYDKALKFFERAKEINPRMAILYVNYGILYQEINKPEEAKQYFEKALKVNPDCKEAKKRLK